MHKEKKNGGCYASAMDEAERATFRMAVEAYRRNTPGTNVQLSKVPGTVEAGPFPMSECEDGFTTPEIDRFASLLANLVTAYTPPPPVMRSRRGANS